MPIRKLQAAGTCVASALMLSLAFSASSADARERGARAEGRAPAAARQGSWTRTSERQRTENGWTRSDRWQGANGKEATRDVSVVRDREAGTRTRTTEWTQPDGRSGSMERVTTRTDTGFTHETRGTLPNGNTFERSIVKDCDKAAGKCTTTVVNNGGAGQP